MKEIVKSFVQGWSTVLDVMPSPERIADACSNLRSPRIAFATGESMAKSVHWVLERRLSELGYTRVHGKGTKRSVDGESLVLARKGSEGMSGDSNEARPHLGLDGSAAATYAKTGHAAAFRIQDGRYGLPEKSSDDWEGSDEDHMPGVSGFANLVNAISDMLGDNDDTTGLNYTSLAGPDPVIVAMVGRQIDAPGGEVVVPSPKIAAVFSKDDVLGAVNARLLELGESPIREFSELEGTEWGKDDPHRVAEILRDQFSAQHGNNADAPEDPGDVPPGYKRVFRNGRWRLKAL